MGKLFSKKNQNNQKSDKREIKNIMKIIFFGEKK
jgi:hypothetical protein